MVVTNRYGRSAGDSSTLEVDAKRVGGVFRRSRPVPGTVTSGNQRGVVTLSRAGEENAGCLLAPHASRVTGLLENGRDGHHFILGGWLDAWPDPPGVDGGLSSREVVLARRVDESARPASNTVAAPILERVSNPDFPANAPSLDGRRFVMTSSTNSAVNASSPSTFSYFERDGVIWGDYEGDTVTFGRFVGTRVGDELAVSFAHVLVSDLSVVTGSSGSVVESSDDGIRLVENFRIGDQDHVSICVEY
jgi:hypothetical protein